MEMQGNGRRDAETEGDRETAGFEVRERDKEDKGEGQREYERRKAKG